MGDGLGGTPLRKEDLRFVTGGGMYTDDIVRPRQLYAHVVRSDVPHALLTSVDTSAASAAPGVVAVFTGADMEADGVGPLPSGWEITNRDGTTGFEPPHRALALNSVRYIGDPIAVVIAESAELAREAARFVQVDYEPVPAVGSLAAAIADGAPLVWDDVPGNICFDWGIGDEEATEAAFAAAPHVVELDLVNNRLIANAMEPRAAIGDFDPGTGSYTLYTTSQNPHLTRLLMSAFVLGIPEHRLRVVSPDVGGGFGSKIPHYPEEAIVTWASGKLGRPVKWTAARSESFVSDTQGRDHLSHAELALDEDGIFLGLRVRTHANLGAYLSTVATVVVTYLYAPVLAGAYRTPAAYCQVKGVFTNTVPVDAYRGAGRPEAVYLLERLVDVAARQLGMDRIEIRRRNLIQPDEFPYQTPIALMYDVGDYPATLDMALKAADWSGFEARRQAAEERGKLRGLGVSTFVEACGLAPSAIAGALGARAGFYESAQVRVHPTGSVTVFTGSHSHGQSHETTFAQIVVDGLGVPYDQVAIVHGDTLQVPFGMGTYGSRSLAVGGSAIQRAIERLIAKATRIAAHLLECSEDEVEFSDGVFSIPGGDESLTFGEIAFAAYVPHNYPPDLEPGLDETVFYDPPNWTYPAGAHVVEVEIDPETGVVEVVRVTTADDVGRVVNPQIVEGQLHGGLTQGIGQALIEGCRYGDDGRLLTNSLMTYPIPRATDVPFFDTGRLETPCTHNPLGVKGVGEVGTIGVPPAVINAVVDALAHLGVEHIDMPATPEKVWRVIQAASPPAV